MKERWLVEVDPGTHVVEYEPLRDAPALFLTFATLDGTEAAIVAFANAYGRLGVERELLAQPQAKRLTAAGDRPQRWREEITRMKHAVRLWQALRGETATLRSLLATWTGPPVPETSEAWAEIAGADLTRRGDLVRVAKLRLQIAVNQQLAEHTVARVLFNPDRDELELHVVPKNLLGALWVEYAHALEGGREYRRCGHCQGWFEISTAQAGRTARAQYCKDLCRVRHHRATKQRPKTKRRSS